MTGTARTVAITGASGLIGRHLCDHFRRSGWTVRALMRDPSTYPFAERGIDRFLLRLPDMIDAASLRGADVVVHAAYSTRGDRRGTERRVNEDGARRLFDAIRQTPAKTIFVSSLSAHEGAVSYYGRSKRAVEGLLDPSRDLIIRAGLVLAADGGMAQRLWSFLMRAHVAPVFGGGRQIVQTVHIEDLCIAFARAIELDLTASVAVADPEGIRMRQLLTAMARASRTWCAFVPMPAFLVAPLLRLSESLGLRFPVSADSLHGLMAMRRVDTQADLQKLGVRLRGPEESIARLAPAMVSARNHRAGRVG